MRSLVLVAVAVVASLMLAGCAAPEDPGGNATTPGTGSTGTQGALVVGTEAAFPPFEDIDAGTGQIVGFDADLMRAIAQRMGRSLELRNLAFDALIPSVQNGQVDAAISAMTITDERKEQVDFSLPYYEANQSIAVRAADTAVQDEEDLRGKPIAVQRGTTAESWVVEHLVAPGHTPNSSLLRYDSFPLSVEALKRGDVDAVMMDAPAVKDAVRTGGGAIRLAFEISTGEQYGIAVRKGNSDVLLGINDALRALRAGGELQQLQDRWGV